MANYERRSSDRDDVRVFDGGEDDEGGEGSHLPVVIIIAILVLAAFGGVVWLAYNQGVARGRNEVPVQIASSETDAGGQIKVYQQPAGPEDEEAAAAPNPMPRAEPVSPASETPVAKRVTQEAPTPAALAPARQRPAPPPVATKPPAQLGLAKPAPAAPKTAPAPAATLKPSVAPGSGYALQIGAYKSNEEAMRAWQVFRGKHAGVLSGYSPDVQRADLGAKGVWYRLRVTPFAGRDAAVALCDRLKADGGACFLAR